MRYADRDNLDITLDEFCQEQANHRVARTTIGDNTVSTVWTGIDTGDGFIFETLVMSPKQIERQLRYRTELEALAGHLECVKDLT